MMRYFNSILAALLALAFLFFGVQKFGATNPVFSILAERSQIELFEPILRMLTGIGEILTAFLLLIPKTRRWGLLTGMAILIGAIGFHLSPWLGLNVPGIGYGLFITALIMLAGLLLLAKRSFN